MAALLTAASVMMCPHGGLIRGIPASTRVMAGTAALRASDTFVVTDCPFADDDRPSPCVDVRWALAARLVRADGEPALNDASVGYSVNDADSVQGLVLVVDTQTRVLAL